MIVVIGAGGIGQAIARRQGAGKSVLLADFADDTLQSAADALAAADEVAAAAAFLLGPEAAFLTGSDLLMDGGVTAARRSPAQ